MYTPKFQTFKNNYGYKFLKYLSHLLPILILGCLYVKKAFPVMWILILCHKLPILFPVIFLLNLFITSFVTSKFWSFIQLTFLFVWLWNQAVKNFLYPKITCKYISMFSIYFIILILNPSYLEFTYCTLYEVAS